MAAALIAALAGCGGESGDLMALQVSGGAEERPIEMVVTGDGRATCNDGDERRLASGLVIDAREVERELSDLAEEGADYGRASADRRGYVARMDDGTVRWQEGQSEPPELGNAALLAVRLERELCDR